MAKTLEEINENFNQMIQMKSRDGPGETGRRKTGIGTLISNLIFYGAILVLILTAAGYTMGDGENPLMGYRIFHVLTDSMDGVYPRGTLILSRQTDTSEIRESDDITFLMSQTMTVTHRVVEVIEDHDGEGNFGFRTQGVANKQLDADIVHAHNVLGKVVWSVPMAGFVLKYLTENIVLTLGIFVLCMLISFALRVFLEERRKAGKSDGDSGKTAGILNTRQTGEEKR